MKMFAIFGFFIFMSIVVLPQSSHAASCAIPNGTYQYLYADGSESYYFNGTHTIRVDSTGTQILEKGDFQVSVMNRTYRRSGNQFSFTNENGTYNSNAGGPIYYSPSARMQSYVQVALPGTSYSDEYGTYTKQGGGQTIFKPKLLLSDLVINNPECVVQRQAPVEHHATNIPQKTDNLTVVRHDTSLIVNMKDGVLFDFNSAVISPGAAETLRSLGQLIKTEGKGSIVIRGHTDSVGTKAYNTKLSAERAQAVATWLRDEEGVPSHNFVIQGLGEEYPVVENNYPDGRDNPAGRAQNRRVEVLIQTVQNAEILEPSVTKEIYYGDTSVIKNSDGSKQIKTGGIEVNKDAEGKTIKLPGGMTVTKDKNGKVITMPDGTVIRKEY